MLALYRFHNMILHRMLSNTLRLYIYVCTVTPKAYILIRYS